MFVLNTLEVEESIYFFKVWFTKIILMSISTGFVIADFDSSKKQRESKSAKPIKQLRHQSLFQVFCTYVVQRNFNPTTLLSHSQASLAFLRYLFWPWSGVAIQHENNRSISSQLFCFKIKLSRFSACTGNEIQFKTMIYCRLFNMLCDEASIIFGWFWQLFHQELSVPKLSIRWYI